MQPNNENSKPAAKGCGNAAPWKSPKNGLSHLAWKSAHPRGFPLSAQPQLLLGYERFFINEDDRKTNNSTSPEINLLQRKNGLDFGVHFMKLLSIANSMFSNSRLNSGSAKRTIPCCRVSKIVCKRTIISAD